METTNKLRLFSHNLSVHACWAKASKMRKLLCKLALPSLAAIALMLCTALPARAQAKHSVVDLMVTTPDGNMYSCELSIVTTPSGRTNGQCTADSMMEMSPVTETIRSDNQMAMEAMEMMGMTMWMTMGMVDVEELPGGTAIVTFHD
jgi:hypothetical protein